MVTGRLFVTAMAGLVMSASSAMAQRSANVVQGRVTGPAARPVPGAEVLLLLGGEVRHVARTDSLGAFGFSRLEHREYSLRVRRLGFQPRSATVLARPPGDGRPVEFSLVPMPTELDAVKVISRLNETNGRLREFYQHRAQSRFGHFFDRDEIASKHPRHLSELMRFVPGARLYPSRLGSVVRIRGCRPLLWIDGVRVPFAELDEMVNMHDVEAVEVYASFAGIPPQYVDRATNCGAVVVWMKS